MSEFAPSTDIVIVGGGIIGTSVAFFLKHEMNFPGSVLVVEPDPTYARSSTTLSAASIRQQFSTPENIRLSLFGLQFIRDLPKRFGPDGDIGFREGGYLILSSEDGLPILKANHVTQVSEGADIALLGADELAARFPWMSTEGIAAGAFGRTGEGWFDAHLLLSVMKKAARAAGVTYVTDRVTSIARHGNTITGVGLASGGTIACGSLVNAAGALAGRVAGLAGIALAVEPRKRCIFVLSCRDKVGPVPLLCDPSGIWVRSEGEGFICGNAPDEANDPAAYDDFEVDHDLFEDVFWPALATRIPAFEALKVVNSWAGHYEFNVLDHNAVLGPHPEVGNFYFANGFSGHGLQQAPASGRAIAEWILDGRSTSLDLDLFRYDRFASGRLVHELNVI